jgi:thiosulfate reductase cytochrome b subunit
MSDDLKRKKQTKERGVTILSTKEQHETLESYKAEQRNTYVRVMLMVNIVFILLLITIAVIALKVSNVLPE